MTHFTVRQRPLDLKLKYPFRTSRGATESVRNVLVEIESDGRIGRGEAAPIGRYHQTYESATHAVDQMASRLRGPEFFFSSAEQYAVPGQRAAQAAVDIALYDLAATRLEVPIYEMLGLDPARTPVTSFTIGIDKQEVVRQKVREASAYSILKIKMGSDEDRKIVELVRDLTDCPIRVDANESWSIVDAPDRLMWLAKLGVEFIEQPLPASQLEETRALRRRSPIPFYADESVESPEDIPGLVGAFDGINIKLAKCGGISQALRMICVARAHGLKVMLGCMVESAVGITAAAHLSPLVDVADLDGNLLLSNDPFSGVLVKDGRLVLPEGPGLGVLPVS